MRLGVHPATVYGLCNRGELVRLRVSNAIRVRLDDLEAIIGAKEEVLSESGAGNNGRTTGRQPVPLMLVGTWFKPGQSGNRSGRPKSIRTLWALLGANLVRRGREEAVDSP